MLDFFKTPVERSEAVVAAGKGNVADRGICSLQKMSAEIDPVLVYQIRKGKVQMAVDKSGDIHPVGHRSGSDGADRRKGPFWGKGGTYPGAGRQYNINRIYSIKALCCL